MKTPLAQNALLRAKRSSLLVAAVAAVLAGCGGNGTPKASDSAPAIKLDSKSTTVLLGASVSFSASASDSGSLPITYQWFLNGRAISSNATAKTKTITIDSVSKGDVGTYTVQATGEFGTSTSKGITLTLQDEGSPMITTQPAPVSTIAGGSATFSVVATATVPPGGNSDDLGPLTYQWYRNGSPVSGATDSTFTINVVPADYTGSTIYVVVTNKIDSVQSNSVALTVASASAPAITTQPVAHTANENAQTTFTVKASGKAPLTYQWFHYAAAVTDPQTLSTLTINPTLRSSAGDYHVVVSGAVDPAATSATANLSVVLIPIITVQPQSGSIVNGSGTLTVTAFGLATTPTVLQTGTLYYTWYNQTGTVVRTESTSPSFTTSTEGTYYVVVRSAAGRTQSSSATLIAPPKITSQPVKATVGVGSTATFTVGATSTTLGGALKYQWYKNGAKVTAADGTGGTTATFTTVATAFDSGNAKNGDQYYVEVSNNNPQVVTSNTVGLTVREAPYFTLQPTDLALKVGTQATINVKADSSNGSSTITYVLYVNNAQVATGGSDGVLKYTPTGAGTFQAYVYAINDGVIQTKSNTVTYTITN